MTKPAPFATEADLVAAYCQHFTGRRAEGWTAYHETAGWDLLMAHVSGVQVGIEAKLSLNAKVLEQALPSHWTELDGPDYRAVLVPGDKCQRHLTVLAAHVGITIITMDRGNRGGWPMPPSLPDEAHSYALRDWQSWLPARRCRLPDYVPDVTGGHSAPVALTPWKIKAIKLLILMERNGSVTRPDMAPLQISPTRWTASYYGFLTRGEGGYVQNERTPDLKAQHPTNWGQIEADFPKWGAEIAQQAKLKIGAAA